MAEDMNGWELFVASHCLEVLNSVLLRYALSP